MASELWQFPPADLLKPIDDRLRYVDHLIHTEEQHLQYEYDEKVKAEDERLRKHWLWRWFSEETRIGWANQIGWYSGYTPTLYDIRTDLHNLRLRVVTMSDAAELVFLSKGTANMVFNDAYYDPVMRL